MNRRTALLDQPDLALAAVFVMLGGIAATGALDAIPLVRIVLTIPLAITFYSVVVSLHVIFAIIGIGTAFSFPPFSITVIRKS